MTGQRVRFVFMTNVSAEHDGDSLLRHLEDFFPHVFSIRTCHANIYRKQINGQPDKYFAVISGVDVVIEDLQEEARRINAEQRVLRRRQGLPWFDFVFKPDDGKPRNGSGIRTQDGSAEFVKRRDYLAGSKVRSLELVTMPTFANGPFRIFKGKRRIALTHANFDYDDIGAMCIVARTTQPVATFNSALECLQAIVRYNGTVVGGVNGNPVFFYDDHYMVRSDDTFGQFLGRNGEKMDFEALQATHGYIPFTEFGEGILDLGFYAAIKQLCYKCDEEYLLMGVDKDLQWLAGVCCCNYTFPPFHPYGAYRHRNERFTRLMTHYSPSNEPNLSPVFPCMQKEYEHQGVYRRIVAPMLEYEVNHRIAFDMAHTETTGTILRAQKVEKVDYGNDFPESKYFLVVETSQTKEWRESLLLHLQSMGCRLTVKNEETGAVYTRGYTCRNPWIRNDMVGRRLIVSFNVLVDDRLEVKSLASLFLKKDLHLLHYSSDFLESWADPDEGIDSPLLQLMLHPQDSTRVSRHNIYFRMPHNMRLQVPRDRMLATLNDLQRLAVTNARSYSFSLICGPPGTGKTHVSACLITLFACISKDAKVLAVAPSTFSVESLRNAVARIITENFKEHYPADVLLVVDEAQENVDIYQNKVPDQVSQFKWLHLEVQKMIKASNNEALIRINRTKYSGDCGPLTDEEEKFLAEQTAIIRKSVLEAHRVQIWSLRAAMELKFGFWRKSSIELFLVDEAGNIPQTFLLPLLNLNAKSVVHVGDYKQLRGTIHAVNCDLSGLSNSHMEWIELGSHTIPTIWLKEQYRMAPTICSLVGRLNYKNELVCAASVPREVPPAIQKAFNLQPNESVMVMSHDGPESYNESGVVNLTEVEIIEDLLRSLFKEGIDKRSITVLTFFDAQKDLLLNCSEAPGLKVRLVDEMQGMEDDVIIVSMVRSQPKSIGGLKHQNRLNVMLSRAKSLLILVMDWETMMEWSKTQFIGKMMRALRDPELDVKFSQ